MPEDRSARSQPEAAIGQPSGGPYESLSPRQLIAWRNAVFVIFAASGVGISSWVARVPAVRDSLGASTSQMGWIVFALAFGSIIGLFGSSHVLVHFGPRRTIVASMTQAAAGLAVVGTGVESGSTVVVVVGLALFGGGVAVCDVAMNVEGAANEGAIRRPIMPWFHASFSVGTIAGAGLGALAEKLGVPVVVHLSVMAAVIILAILVSVRALPAAIAGAEPSTEERAAWRERLAIWRDRRTVLIGVIVLGMAFAEGSASDWLALAMVDGHGTSNTVGAIVFGVFVTAMTVGRIAGVSVLARYGRVPVLRVSAVIAAIGLTIVIFAPQAWIAVFGVVLWGLGAALGFPVGMSAAADDPAIAPARVSAVATIGYLAFLVGPPLVGFIGQQTGLLLALLTVLVLIALSGLVSSAAREAKPAERELANGPRADY